MNREMRRHGREMGLPDWMYEEEYGDYEGFGDWEDDLFRGLSEEEYDQMRMHAFEDEFMLPERPTEDYGVVSWFVGSFIRPDMEDAFEKAASDFLWNDPMARDRELFRDLVLPFSRGGSIRYTFHAIVLSMMLVCARGGSQYAEQLILNLYKTFYKEEYNVFKRMHVLDISVYAETFYKDGMSDDEDHTMTARLTVMGELMKKETDQSWNRIYKILNEDVYRSRFLWRLIEAAEYKAVVQENLVRRHAENAEWLAENFPEMATADAYGEDERYEILIDIWNEVGRAIEKCGATDDILHQGRGFDLFTCASDIAGVCQNYMDGSEENDTKMLILFSVIRYLAESFGELYVEREKELCAVLGVCRREIVDDSFLEGEGVSKEAIEKMRGSAAEPDPRTKKMLRLLETLQASEKGRRTAQAAVGDEAEIKNGRDRRDEALRAGNGAKGQEASGTGKGKGLEEGAETERLRQLLARKEAQLKEAERKARMQRELYEESRARERALEKVIEKQKGEHAELTALRELAYSLENEERGNEEWGNGEADAGGPRLETIMDALREKQCAIIGGQKNWINKMKRQLPGWTFISVNDSLNLDRALGGVEAAFLYTDTLSHKMYYRMMNTIKDREIPFHYIHGTNIEKVAMAMYDELSS